MLNKGCKKYIPFSPVSLPDRTWPDKVITKAPIWCSVDLRDGNQALIDPMNLEEKLLFFKTLVEIGFKEIEIGFPSASETEYEICRALIERNLIPDDVTIQVLVQCRPHLIQKTFEAIDGAKNVIVHFYNSTSTLQRKVVFKTDMQGSTRYALDGMDMYFPINGAFDPGESLAIVGDWSQLVYAIRQDMTFKIFDSGVIQDPSSKSILYNLMQNDMVALRAVMRLGWEIPNPINAYNADLDAAFPFAVYAAATGTISTVAVTPDTPTVTKGSGQQFAASVTGTGGPYSTAVSWSVSGTKAVAAGTQITQAGYLTIDEGETNTSLTVTAKSKQDTSKTDTATVTVTGG